MSVESATRLASLFAAVGVLAGCAVPPAGEPANAPPPASSPSARPAASPTPVEAPPVAPPAAPVVPAAPVSAAQQQQAHKMALAATDALEAGNEDQARNELEAALAVDPNSKLAQNLLKQITADPQQVLGRDSFAYTVRSSDTLSRIAGRFLGDIYSFYILARYNEIKVPRQVAAGQVLRIPGKAAPPGADRDPPAPPPRAAAIPAAPAATPAPAPAPTPVAAPAPPAPIAPAEPPPGARAMSNAEAAERAGDLDRALSEYNRAAGLDQPQAAGKATAVRRKMVLNSTQAARAAMAKQDLDGSIRHWDRVLAMDPGNDTAKLERQRALTLREKLKGIK